MSGAEQAAWKGRAIAAADALGESAVSNAIKLGGAEVAIRLTMTSLTSDRAARLWAALLDSMQPGALPDMLTMITHGPWRSDAYPLPSFRLAPASTSYLERLDLVRDQLRTAAGAAGRTRVLRIVEYLAMVCATVRLSERRVTAFAFAPGNGPVARALVDAMVLGSCQEVILQPPQRQQDVALAFVLAVNGYAPLGQAGGTWQVQQVFA